MRPQKREVIEKLELITKICERAESFGYNGDRMTLMMDLESADKKFNLRLKELLIAEPNLFVHDIHGIITHIDRSVYPATDFGLFVPRYAGNFLDSNNK